MHGHTWVYDFQSVVSVATLVFGFAGCVPVSIWFVLRQLDAKVKLINIICLYGYALFIYIPASVVCLAPSAMVSWTVLLLATVQSSVFLLRNLGPLFVSQARQQAPIFLAAVGGIQLILTLFLKFGFYNSF